MVRGAADISLRYLRVGAVRVTRGLLGRGEYIVLYCRVRPQEPTIEDRVTYYIHNKIR